MLLTFEDGAKTIISESDVLIGLIFGGFCGTLDVLHVCFLFFQAQRLKHYRLITIHIAIYIIGEGFLSTSIHHHQSEMTMDRSRQGCIDAFEIETRINK